MNILKTISESQFLLYLILGTPVFLLIAKIEAKSIEKRINKEVDKRVNQRLTYEKAKADIDAIEAELKVRQNKE